MKEPGDRVDRYVIEAALGAGGMGEVYEAWDARLERRVALKLIRGDARGSSRGRLLREAQAAAAFEHPGVVIVYDVGETGGEMFIAMELVRGRPLRDLIGDASAPAGRKLRWLVDAARALGAAHRAGLIHRDMKPDNVMIRGDGAVKVLDFGIARWQDAPTAQAHDDGDRDPAASPDPPAPVSALDIEHMRTLTAEGAVIGTPLYASPEQLRGEAVDARTDQFSWAVMGYELLAGAAPWRATTAMELLSEILTREPPPIHERGPDIPQDVSRILERALAKRSSDRYARIDDAADELEPHADAPFSVTLARERREQSSLGAAATTGLRTGPTSADAPRTSSRARTSPASASSGALTGVPAPYREVLTRRRAALIGAAAALGLGAALLAAKLRAPEPTLTEVRVETIAPLVVPGLTCESAASRGGEASADLLRIIGVGSCARLAIDLGVGWNAPGATRAVELSVEAELNEGGAVITMAVGDRRSTGRGATAIEAMDAASAALSKQLTGPPTSAEEIAWWGARDAAAALRIKRAWRRYDLKLAPDHTELRELLKTDADSAWTLALAVHEEVFGTDGLVEQQAQALARAGDLPPDRALGLKARLFLDDPMADSREQRSVLRQAYAATPDDPQITALYAFAAVRAGEPDEGYALIDRLFARAPEHAFRPIADLMWVQMDHNLARDQSHIEKLRSILPETFASDLSIRHYIRAGDLAEARRALDLARKIGKSGAQSGAWTADTGQLWIESASFQPEAVRAIAARLIGEPSTMMWGALWMTQAYMMEGRAADAESILLRQVERYRDAANVRHAVEFTWNIMRWRRWLGLPLLDERWLSWMDESVRGSTLFNVTYMPRAELVLSRFHGGGPAQRQVAERELDALDAHAEVLRSKGDVSRSDILRILTIPLARVLRGDQEAAKRWLEARHATHRARRLFALDAGLALEAAGYRREAEDAYMIAKSPDNLELDTIVVMLANIKLAALYRASGRTAEAAAIDAVIDRVWARADRGVREGAARLR